MNKNVRNLTSQFMLILGDDVSKLWKLSNLSRKRKDDLQEVEFQFQESEEIP